MSSATSADRTTISYDRNGNGPPVILVLGAFNERATGAPLAAHLAGTFTVVNYDRRGRGTSNGHSAVRGRPRNRRSRGTHRRRGR